MNNTMTLIIGLILTFIILSSVRRIIFNIKSRGKFKNINVNEAVSLYKNNKNIVLIDVRSYMEVQQSEYIVNSINIALDDSKFEEKMSKLDKNKEYIVYCASGNRSGAACFRMHKMGFTNINNLTRAGYFQLSSALN
ncbi:rhodanese-like domain-containing protein [Brachyspira alvinipulli]|uniref:rhodanese-like domain-containing protein n=1 Tax=Brachyspira alvinipulli TaxID=84379 RepID=UPI0004871630|nr:rhodanese-like domain-containing protein [Brachyspira alvinipulli]